MASAMDSGFDTGNDSNDYDSSVQDNLSKMDQETSPQSKSSDSARETNSEEEQDDGNQNPSSPKIVMVEPGVAMSITHLQPTSLSHGYEQPVSPSSEPPHKGIKYVLLNVKDSGGVFVSGGPFGTEYKGSDLVCKMHRRMNCIRHPAIRLKCLRNRAMQTSVFSKYSENYAKYRDMKRMCRAACTNNTMSMREMLEAGLSPNCHDGYKRSPLHLAACLGYADMVKLLLDHGADPNAKDSIGNTPLHLAACTNHVDVITLLLKAGTRVTERDMAGHSPLQLAITKFNIMKRSIMPHPVLKEQVCQVISMLTEYMRRKEGSAIDPDLLNKFESLVRVSDSSEEVESNIRDLLNNLSTLSLSGSS